MAAGRHHLSRSRGGFFSYGVSLVLFVLALRHLGTARTGAYFSLAPFVGAVLAVVAWSERPGLLFLVATACMSIGVWLHVSERHEYAHVHEEMDHEHVRTCTTSIISISMDRTTRP